MFSRKNLTKLIFPLIVEQFLAVTIGMADTIMVSGVGQAAVSGLSLVDSINILLINIFAALATGGAVVASQYIGREDRESACVSAKQLIVSTTLFSLIIMVLSLIGHTAILDLIFGNVEADVMSNAQTYFIISACSYPFIALYNSGAALFRSMGNSKITMITSIIMNLVNVVFNAILIYKFNMGVAGAAIASLISRLLGSIIMLYLLRNDNNEIYIDSYKHLGFKPDTIKKILTVGIPTGLENGMFQIGKIALQSLIATFGTAAIAANAIANNFASLEVIPGMAIGLATVTIVGQCIGANNYDMAKKYMLKLMKYAYIIMFFLNITILIFAKPLIGFYNLSSEVTDIAMQLLICHGVGAMVIWIPSFTLPNGLRAANDAKFTMTVSIFSMWVFRIGFGYLLGKFLGIGVLGVWIAIIIDWTFRSTMFLTRLFNGKWRNKQLL
ncbi:MAG: MATE family efflux transporter [Clostridium sp.]